MIARVRKSIVALFCLLSVVAVSCTLTVLAGSAVTAQENDIYIDWGGAGTYYDASRYPTVATDGQYIIEAHHSSSSQLWYHLTDSYDIDKGTINWGSPHEICDGLYPSVAACQGQVVITYQTNSGDNKYRRGTIQGSTIQWRSEQSLGGSGELQLNMPAVDMFYSDSDSKIYVVTAAPDKVRVGTIESDSSSTINWSFNVTLPYPGQNYCQYDVAAAYHKKTPSGIVVVTASDKDAAKHNRNQITRNNVGTIDIANKMIHWSGWGMEPNAKKYEHAACSLAPNSIDTLTYIQSALYHNTEATQPGDEDKLMCSAGELTPPVQSVSFEYRYEYQSGSWSGIALFPGKDMFVEVHNGAGKDYENNLYYYFRKITVTKDQALSWAHASIGSHQAAAEWLLPEGCTGPGFETWILVQNPGTTDANVQLTYMTNDGQVPGPSQVLKAGSRATFNVAETVGQNWQVSTRVTSDKPVVAERAMYGANRDWAHASIGSHQAAAEWLLPEGCTGPGFETWVLVQNPGTTDANVQLTYMTNDGQVPGPSQVVKAGSRATFDVAETVGQNWQVSTRVTSDKPLVAERAMYGANRDWAHASIGSHQAAAEWLLPEGCTGPGFETWVLVQNPGTTDANVQLTYMTNDGQVPGPSQVLKAGSRATFDVAETVGQNWQVSTRVTSDKPVVAERAMYGANRDWAHASIGSHQAAAEWLLPEGCTGPGFETWILVQNPGTTDANVQLTYMTVDGKIRSHPPVVVKAGSRATFNVAETVGQTWGVATRVTSDKPVVAERAMYGPKAE